MSFHRDVDIGFPTDVDNLAIKTALNTAEADIVTGNIKSGITIFGVAGSAAVQDISDSNALVGEVNSGRTLNLSVGFSKGGASVTKSKSLNVTVTGDAFTHAVQEVGTVEEELVQGADLGTPGYVYIINLDSTNYVEIGSTTGVYQIKLKAGEFALFRHNSSTIYAKANTGACNVEYLIVED
jgi:hypothetical protein